MNKHCFTCIYEPNWSNNQGKCKFTVSEFGEEAAIILRRYFDPNEVITIDGDRVVDCTGWEDKNSVRVNMRNPVTELVKNILKEIQEDILADYKSTDYPKETYLYWRGYIDGVNKRKIFTKEEISSLIELNRSEYWKKIQG